MSALKSGLAWSAASFAATSPGRARNRGLSLVPSIAKGAESFSAQAIPFNRLTADHLDRWRALQHANRDLAVPTFCPEFIRAVASVSDTVEVAVLTKNAEVVGFFPFQRGVRGRSDGAAQIVTALGAAGPVGFSLTDGHGLIIAQDCAIDLGQVLEKCGINAWDFSHLPMSQVTAACEIKALEETSMIDLSQGYEGFLAAQKASGSSLLSQTARKARGLARDVGALRFVAVDTDPAARAQVIKWYMQKHAAANGDDPFRASMTDRIMTALSDTRTPYFRSQCSLLYAGDQLVAGHFGLRQGAYFQYWYLGYNPEFEKYSPGITLLQTMIEALAADGISEIDMGKGHHRYKVQFRTHTRLVAAGSLALPSVLKTYRDAKALLRGREMPGSVAAA